MNELKNEEILPGELVFNIDVMLAKKRTRSI